jgi:hypothetical protein
LIAKIHDLLPFSKSWGLLHPRKKVKKETKLKGNSTKQQPDSNDFADSRFPSGKYIRGTVADATEMTCSEVFLCNLLKNANQIRCPLSLRLQLLPDQVKA